MNNYDLEDDRDLVAIDWVLVRVGAAVIGIGIVAAFLVMMNSNAKAASLNGVVQPLQAKAMQIVTMCKTSVIAGVVRKNIAGTGRRSLHASGRAVDIRAKNRHQSECIYAQLSGWPGGYSRDWWYLNHVHVSIGGPEQGLRFYHRHAAKRNVHRLTRAPAAPYPLM
jgi:hypothetical protein